MTSFAEICHSHTYVKGFGTGLAGVKKMHVLMRNKRFRRQVLGNSATMAEIQLGNHLIPRLYVKYQTRLACAVAAHSTARKIGVITRIHST